MAETSENCVKLCGIKSHSSFTKSNFPCHFSVVGPSMRSASPHNVRIANLCNDGGLLFHCPHPGCIAVFTTSGTLRKHTHADKHKFAPNLQPSFTSPQHFRLQLVVKTPAKTPRTHKTAGHQLKPLFSDSENSDDDSSENINTPPPLHPNSSVNPFYNVPSPSVHDNSSQTNASQFPSPLNPTVSTPTHMNTPSTSTSYSMSSSTSSVSTSSTSSSSLSQSSSSTAYRMRSIRTPSIDA